MSITPTRLSFVDGVPFSEDYGDVYYSASGGYEQSCHVFMAGNGLPARWAQYSRFSILETGFGLGINFLTTWKAWREDTSRCEHLEFISIEKHPVSARDLKSAHEKISVFHELSDALCSLWPEPVAGEYVLSFDAGRVTLKLIFGDALEVLPVYQAKVDALYLDGFSPAKNPDLWSPTLCKSLALLARAGTTLATWSVAGHVRRSLAEAGFSVEKSTGFGNKRQMLVGCYNAQNGDVAA